MAYHFRGSAHHEQSEYNKAIDDYTSAIVLYADDCDKGNAHHSRGKAYEKLGKQVKAEADFAKANQLRKN